MSRLANDFASSVSQDFYRMNDALVLSKLKSNAVITDEGFIDTNDSSIIIPFDTCDLSFYGEAINKDEIYLGLVAEAGERQNLYDFDNYLYNLCFIKCFKKFKNKDELNFLTENPVKYYKLLMKYKNSHQMYSYFHNQIKYTNKNSYASNPGGTILSSVKFVQIAKLFNPKEEKKLLKNRNKIIEHLMYGDVQPAKVVSIEPFIISIYSEDLDAVVMVEYPKELVEIYDLKIDDKLISVNLYLYMNQQGYANDIIPTNSTTGTFRDVIPLIALFLTDNEHECKEKVSLISLELWSRMEELSLQYPSRKPNQKRKCFEYYLK